MADPGNAPVDTVDPDAVQAFAFTVWNYKQGEMVSLMIHLGDRLGIYAHLDGAGPVTAAELARRSGLHERWLLEWLRANAAARLLDYHDGDRFELTDVGALVLARADSPSFAAAACGEPRPFGFVDRLAGAFESGIGLSYDDLGAEAAHHVERMLGPMARALLVPVVIPTLDGVQAKLERGALVADVGCGAGLALQLLAEAFPASTFHGYDLSEHAIAAARQRFADAGITNVEMFAARAEDLPTDPVYDLVLTFDCIHDMTRPDLAIAAIRRAIKDDGTWLVKDIRSAPDFVDNMKNPMLAMMYSSSVATCMSSAMSEEGGLGLGTLGFNPAVVDAMARAAGFTRITTHDVPDPANFYYEIRLEP
jgi:2-polyprenyl-3-methyl-5-hydroxy-6-metoxy-1,4-benzoquinol methylase